MTRGATTEARPCRNGAGETPSAPDPVMDLAVLLPDLAVALCEAAPHGCRGLTASGTLTGRQTRAVIYLAHRRGTTMTELAAGLGISRAAATELVTRLEDKGVVRREAAGNDRRLVLVSLSGQAEGYADEVLLAWRNRVAAALAQFPDLDATALAAFLRTLMRQWKSPAAP